MKTKELKAKEAPASVYKELAKEISQVTEGVEYHEGEAYVMKSGLYYTVEYTMEKHWDELRDREWEYLTIIDWHVWDAEEMPVDVTMNPAEIEAYFDKRPNYDLL